MVGNYYNKLFRFFSFIKILSRQIVLVWTKVIWREAIVAFLAELLGVGAVSG